MAKKDEQKAKPSENGHNKVQGFVFGINLEGSKEVVLEGIKSFTAAMTAGGAATFAAPPRKPAALASGRKSTAATTIDAEEPEATEVGEVLEEEITAPDTEEEETGSNGNGSTPRQRRIPPTPNLVSDLDITAEPMPLKTFLEQKGPRKAQDRMAVVATWLKKHRNYQEISRDHFYSVYQQMGGAGDWKCLNNWDVLIRQLAKRKGWFEKGTNEASYKVSIVATNYVDAMTPTGA
jgi:hypothetical protein